MTLFTMGNTVARNNNDLERPSLPSFQSGDVTASTPLAITQSVELIAGVPRRPVGQLVNAEGGKLVRTIWKKVLPTHFFR